MSEVISEQNGHNRHLHKILWRCRRGTRELDQILADFVKKKYHTLSMQDRNRFDLLLQMEDPLLTEWLCLDGKPKDQGMAEIVQKILSAD